MRRTTTWLAALGMLLIVVQAQSRLIPVFVPTKVTLNPGTVTGGQSINCTVTLSGATVNDQSVQITTDHPQNFTNFPASVVVPAGATSITFPIQTSTVSATVSATVTAACNGGQASNSMLCLSRQE